MFYRLLYIKFTILFISITIKQENNREDYNYEKYYKK